MTNKLKKTPLKKKPGYPKGRKRTPKNVLAISNAWRNRERTSTKVTIKLTPAEMERLIRDAEAVEQSASAFVRTIIQARVMHRQEKDIVTHD